MAAEAGDRLWDIGLRGGVGVNRYKADVGQVEVFAGREFPATLRSWRALAVTLRVEGGAGIIEAEGEGTGIASAGVSLDVTKLNFPLSVELGLAPAVISRSHFDDHNLGGPIQFVSHVGLNWRISDRWKAVYRLQHMSNAGIYGPNPGLNMHLVGLAYRF